MNYYEHHLGDYAKDTGHLTMLEHGAYRILLDRYYSTEQGIPADQAYRLARARSQEECRAVDVILEEFFELVDGVWIHGRVEHEIELARKRISVAQQNGKKGGRPRKEPKGLFEKTQDKPSGLFVGSDSETQTKAHHLPSTNLPIGSKAAASQATEVAREAEPPAAANAPDPIPPGGDATANRPAQITVLLRRNGGCSRTHPGSKGVAELVSLQATDVEILTALETAKQRRREQGNVTGITPAYLLPIVQGLRTAPPARAGPGKREKFDPSEYVNRERISRQPREPSHDSADEHRTIDIDAVRLD